MEKSKNDRFPLVHALVTVNSRHGTQGKRYTYNAPFTQECSRLTRVVSSRLASPPRACSVRCRFLVASRRIRDTKI